ncbi:MAG: hypothetical protein KKD48_00350 [Nanoarchaeota archaeon]|nr:hypothetical protein [Nanoarchaeota archaeon]
MKAKTKCMEMFSGLPDESQQELILDPYGTARTLNVCYLNIKHNTQLGKQILNRLGYKDDKTS